VKETLLLVCLITLCNLNLAAQTGPARRAVHTREKSAIHMPSQEVPESLTTIYNNLGTKTNAYLATDGWDVTGFNSFGGSSNAFSVALPFTPKSEAHVTQVRAAIEYLGFWGKSGEHQRFWR
jgi:hypothetical protein